MTPPPPLKNSTVQGVHIALLDLSRSQSETAAVIIGQNTPEQNRTVTSTVPETRMWLISLLCFCSIFRIARGAGVGVHLTLLARTLLPREQFEAHQPFLKAGAFFPDALYSCNSNPKWHAFAEATHWPPFLVSCARYWHERYGDDPFSSDSLRLQAFLVGVFTHQVTDASWHSLVRHHETHGMISVLSQLEFDGDFEQAHTFADVMGDFLVLGDVLVTVLDNWLYYTDQTWQLPCEQDMMELVRRAGLQDIGYRDLQGCLERGMLAATGEVYSLMKRRKQVLELAYGVSPRSREFVQEHWLGGEFDIVAVINRCLPTLLSLFDHTRGFEQVHALEMLQVCGNLPPASLSETRAASLAVVAENAHKRKLVYVSPMVPVSNFGSSLAVGKFQHGEVCIAVGAPLEEKSGSVYVIPWGELSGAPGGSVPADGLLPLAALLLSSPLSASSSSSSSLPCSLSYGAQVHGFVLNDVHYLLVAEPGSNSMHFYRNGLKTLSVTDTTSQEPHWLSVSAVQDVDGDGIPDLLLGAPHYGRNETGAAVVVHGLHIAPHLLAPAYHEVELSELGTIYLRGPLSHGFQHFGARVVASYVGAPEGFLYVTSQSLGVVFVYCLGTLQQSALPRYYIINDSVVLAEEDVPLELEKQKSIVHGMFGRQVHTWNYKNVNFVAISQHLKNRVYIYRETHGSVEYCLKLQLDVATDLGTVFPSIGFGASLVYDAVRSALYVSSPGSFDGEGAVWEVGMQEIVCAADVWRLDSLIVNAAAHLVATGRNGKNHGVAGFGKTLAMGPDGSVVVGAPHYGYGNLENNQLIGSVALLQ